METLGTKFNFFTNFILVLLFVLGPLYKGKSQLEISLSTNSSTCENNGAVTANVSSGIGPYSFRIRGDDNYESLNSSAAQNYTWTSLFPGKYYITVTNESFIAADSIEVLGNYTSLDGVASIIKKADCPDSFDGEIMLETEGGKAPFNFQLYEGTYDPNASPISENQSGYFIALNAQIYTIISIDSCSNQIARTVNLTVTEPLFQGEVLHSLLSCDSVLLIARIPELFELQDYQVRIISPNSLVTEYSDSIKAVYGYEESQDIKYEFIDPCGRTYIKNSGVPLISFQGGAVDFICEGYSIFYFTNYTSPYDITLTLPTGEVLLMDTLPVLENIPYGDGYLLQIEDACGRSSQVFYRSFQYSKVNEITVTQNPCFLQNSAVVFNLDGRAIGPVTLEFIAHPDDFQSEIYTWNNGGTNFIINDSQVEFKTGAYEGILTDSCGTKDTVRFQIDNADLLDIELLTNVIPQCSDLSHITFNTVFNSEFIRPGTATLTKQSNNGFMISESNVLEGSFSFLDTGTYYLAYSPCGSSVSMVFDTITLDTTPFPQILSASTINCENEDSIAILVNGDLGIAPYLYRIVEGANTEDFPTEWQDLPLLGKVPLGQGYKVQLLDQCGTTTSSDVSEVLNLEPVVIEDYFLCNSDTVIFSIEDPLIGLSYQWTGPNNAMSDTTLLKMHKNDITSPIFLQTNVSGCTSSQISYDWSQECLLSVELLNFSVEEADDVHLLRWSTTEEINNSHFDIQHSRSSVIWETIGKVPGTNQLNGRSNYSFINKNPLHGLNYYRLKQNDFNGRFEYSDILYLNKEFESPIIYPNPTLGILEVKYINDIGIKGIDIFNIQGDLVYQKSIGSTSQFEFDLGSLAPGFYYLRIRHANLKPYVTSLIKN